MEAPTRYLIGLSSAVIAVFSGLGFYLISGKPVIKDLVASGHNHMLSFAFGAILFALILNKLNLSKNLKWILAVWMSLTFFGPLALIYAGFTGNTSILKITDVVFQGSFVVLWLAMAYFVASSDKH